MAAKLFGCCKFIITMVLVGMVTFARADIVDTMEKALMPGELINAHKKFEEDCTKCHEFFAQSRQDIRCLKCHDHKNVADDIKKKEGYHGRIPNVEEKECKTCHRDHIGRDAVVVLMDEQTFDHGQTDFVLRGGHLDIQCLACHKKDKKYHQAKRKCIDCHKDNEPHKGKLGKVCDTCHRESSWNDFQFDHSRTDFKLEGNHKGVECRDCHPQERYEATPTKCYGCHKRDDKHKGRYGKKCKKCHTPLGWANQKFNHDKDTKFKLSGRHKKVGCDQCHEADVNAYEEELKTDCYSCHEFSDEHKGQYGKKCKDCHTTRGWAKQRFDHNKTDFPLKGKHEDTACSDCHRGEMFAEEMSTKCYDCHVQHDVHDGQQGKKCDDCHSEEGWLEKVEFDHDITKFPLLSSHAAVGCEECHSSSNFKDAKPVCGTCHIEDDTHKKRLGPKCGTCHNSVDFKAWEFDHDKQTDFKLTGEHEGKDCLLCHREVVEKEIELTAICYGCHAVDDIHDGGFGRGCNRCHNEKSFKELEM